jgi:predicted glycoside hydrolase/deacetylase ChbG (UPF0249 family)
MPGAKLHRTRANRRLIVNADDFGRTEGINRGIIEAHEHGIVTSASLMVRYPAAAAAADYAKTRPHFSLGLHLELAEWYYAGPDWKVAYQVIDSTDARAVETELERQISLFMQLAGGPPSHLDSHQHIHQSEPTRSIALRAAEKLGIPLRHASPTIAYCGDFYGQTGRGEPYPEGITRQHLARTIHQLPTGWTELACHAGYADGFDSVYAGEREEEVRVLCSPEIREAVNAAGIRLCSFRDAVEHPSI